MNHMEDKQLKFNQPLLSVRRISPAMISQRDEKKTIDNSFRAITHPPHFKSELKSGLVGKPGTVPFLWEDSPGRPKDERGPQIHFTENPPTFPKLPPGWKLRENQDFEKDFESTKIQTGNILNAKPSCDYLDENIKKIESFDSSKEMTGDKENIESEDGDETYLDARDTLSRTESSFLNCNVSGLSGYDEPNAKPFRTSLTDPRAKDLMMGRFLPAAKAMASDKTSETPYYVRKKQPPVQDQSRQIKKVLNGDRRPQLRYGPSFTLYHSQAHDNEEEESDDDCYDNGDLATKVCGLLPHFCLKSSFRLLNLVPGMSVRTRVPVSPVSRTQTGSLSTASCSGTENEVNSTYANDPYEHKSILGSTAEANDGEVECLGLQKNTFQSFQELLSDQNNSREVDLSTPVVEKTLYIDIVHKMESVAKISCSPDRKPSNLQHEDVEILERIIKQKPFVDSSLDSSEKSSLKSYLQRRVDFSPPHSAENLSNGRETKALTATGQAQDCCQDAMTLTKPEIDVRETTRKPILRREKVENSCKVHPEFLVPPPLPKSPSDSWLCRTLPSLSTKNAPSRSYIGTGINNNNQFSKPVSSDPKWEAIVKMTKKQQPL
ncbi:uncharacterized protein LOC107806799 [Nicotiana tabacum]|uniref:Protein JASON-like n=2 Tax=Nicotiana TaxID=4085 RepID=A0A1S4BCH6_TOBAC|nr:PREDICTED: uncharacterized protein LOC104237722 [Nicotiana sylvestris]XP_009790224.1 PREDICTED: uncharacterized protein LOC104237722 [Nicotiana sylvestris]XP_009790225.1 PREDICTED: uncharacterized protein LOC104237722 [Nicotiana sylvestris]XP_016486521.1 PREDICTED: uncharacterized protein LOC107806799 [Nicotiana tabacum]XP_016486522.1 PREDICTED: uncharacterized protein LOC107806799 [Nicotiana tabacum]XP_016486523.1 PREDICTED: uncharacterized protein LOC107806799 [Nicotiana tabacum]